MIRLLPVCRSSQVLPAALRVRVIVWLLAQGHGTVTNTVASEFEEIIRRGVQRRAVVPYGNIVCLRVIWVLVPAVTDLVVWVIRDETVEVLDQVVALCLGDAEDACDEEGVEEKSFGVVSKGTDLSENGTYSSNR